MFFVSKAKFKVFGLGCAIINTRENNVNGRCAKINPRENKFFSRAQGARKLIRAKISTNKVFTGTILIIRKQMSFGIRGVNTQFFFCKNHVFVIFTRFLIFGQFEPHDFYKKHFLQKKSV